MAGLNAGAMTSLGAARVWVLRDENNASQDDLLAFHINGVSRAVARYCGREFFPVTAEERIFSYDGGGFLSLDPYDLRTATSITVTPAGSTDGWILDPASPDFKPEPRNKTPEGTYLWIRMPLVENPGAWPPNARIGMMSDVTILGDWGMAALPDDLEEAVLMTVDWRYKNPTGSRAVQTGGLSLDSYTPQGDVPRFPPEAMAILDDLARDR